MATYRQAQDDAVKAVAAKKAAAAKRRKAAKEKAKATETGADN